MLELYSSVNCRRPPWGRLYIKEHQVNDRVQILGHQLLWLRLRVARWRRDTEPLWFFLQPRVHTLQCYRFPIAQAVQTTYSFPDHDARLAEPF